jgi:hypothetical protein
VAKDKFERGLAGLLGAGANSDKTANQETTMDIHFAGQLLGFDFSASPHLREILGTQSKFASEHFMVWSGCSPPWPEAPQQIRFQESAL